MPSTKGPTDNRRAAARELRATLTDKGVAFGFQEAADVAREMGNDVIADALRAEGIRRYEALPPIVGGVVAKQMAWETLHDVLGRASGLLHNVLSLDRSGVDTPNLIRAVSLLDEAIEILADSDPLAFARLTSKEE